MKLNNTNTLLGRHGPKISVSESFTAGFRPIRGRCIRVAPDLRAAAAEDIPTLISTPRNLEKTKQEQDHDCGQTPTWEPIDCAFRGQQLGIQINK